MSSYPAYKNGQSPDYNTLSDLCKVSLSGSAKYWIAFPQQDSASSIERPVPCLPQPTEVTSRK